MRKCFRFFPPVFVLAFLVAMGGVAVAQEDITEVDDSGFETRIRPPAVFNHEEHNEAAELDCTVCHHVYEDGELLEDETSEDSECSECHGDGSSRNLDLVAKYHTRCKGCHEEEGAGPVVCSECHVK
jgi:glycyl-tRNA synthetase (class II)